MTEEQAQEKWCPQSTVGALCMASKCMAWRWSKKVTYGKPLQHVPFKPRVEKIEMDGGYCGLAGNPIIE